MKLRNLTPVAIVLALAISAVAQTRPVPASAPAADVPVVVKWSTTDLQGQKVVVPATDRPTVILFVRADQPQSQQAVRQSLPIIQATGKVQSILVLSGHQDQVTAQKLAQQFQWNGAVVLDPEYTASGEMRIHVWPTTVLANANGEQVAHLGGVSNTYATELGAYLQFAAGTIDHATLKQRLATSNVVGDSNEQMASRHLQVAERLLDKGRLEEARNELAEGLKREPGSVPLKVAMAKVLLQQGDAKSAMALIDGLDQTAVAPWQLNLLRGRAALVQGQVDQAIVCLQSALKLNPNPAEVQYELGKAYQQKGDHQQAAAAFRAAFEATATGRGLVGARK
jgi:tetratricopeptide (TPR) repeat protein